MLELNDLYILIFGLTQYSKGSHLAISQHISYIIGSTSLPGLEPSTTISDISYTSRGQSETNLNSPSTSGMPGVANSSNLVII